ncbi:MAG: M20/M25/M40 family metallo-hydrolase [Deltaproteobacteria bacterium]|nr:M20/M25/M40 family metallo-hydrolase [Deltaproteobacteria bacterium]MDQ3301562.1 M20/M25/M40 family metallo-hydrolase [Myxococcota bacterium]
MRSALIVVATLAALLGGCASPPVALAPPEVGIRYITIGTDAIATAREVAGDHASFEVLEAGAEVAVLAVDAADLEALSEQMHEQHSRCGGFVLHESIDEARAAARDVDDDDARGQSAVAVDYTIDQGASVHLAMAALDRRVIVDTIRTLSAMPNRHYRSATGAEASLWLRDRWRGLTTRTDVTVELFDHGYPQQSVILTIPGRARAGEIVVLGAHLDSIALGGSASTAPGADDDASGIATLTEIARVLLAADYRPARTVQFMAYAAEEVGLRGSQGIVRAYKQRKVNVVGALQLDMTNYQGSEKDIWLMKDFTNAAQNTFLTELIETYVGATWGLDACGYACSDHAAWYRAGVPASMPFESRMSQRNKSIHTSKDTLETSGNNAAHALKFARLGIAYAIELAKGELAPATTAAAAPYSPRQVSWGLLAAFASLGLLGAGAWLSRVALRGISLR